MSAPPDERNHSAHRLLTILVDNRGSDLHLQVGEAPIARIDGRLGRFEMEALTDKNVLDLAHEILATDSRFNEFLTTKEFDTALEFEDIGRFRVNLFFQRGKPGMVLRAIGSKIPTVETMGLPEVLRDLATIQQGLILVTGATGSGKSTTLAAMIDHINETQPRHIVTLEDPIEYVHANKIGLINQREIHVDSESYAAGLKHALRQDPDVILIGEIRDVESVSTALTAAETGHLVFATLHTHDAAESLERLINMYPKENLQQIRMQLSLGLYAILCQKLVPKAGGGRTAAIEILINTPLIKKLILEGDTTKIPSAIQSSRSEKMQTFNQALVDLVKAGTVSEEDALEASPKVDELRMNFKGIYSGTSGL